MNYVLTFAILIAVLIVIRHSQGQGEPGTIARILAQHDQDEQFRRDFQNGLAAGGKDRLDALIEATREHPHESYAWGPDADDPIPYVEVTDFADWEAEYQRHRAEQEESER